MKLTGNTILITGGATGIGFALAEQFSKLGNTVIICGRRVEMLDEATGRVPGLQAMECDVSDGKERERLFNEVTEKFPALNILVNNAGVQRMIDFKKGIGELLCLDGEIDINLTAAVHLSAWFTPWLMKKKESAIINISSGLGFVPISFMPVYCATKAALHSFTLSIRHQLKDTPVRVFEIIPPTVDTDLDKGERERRGQKYRGIKPEEVAVEAIRGLESDTFEFPIGQAGNLVQGSRTNPEQFFRNLNP
jgi:uncharacterized oxidoreductase